MTEERASLPRTKDLDTVLGKVSVGRPRLKTLTVVARALQDADLDISLLTKGGEKKEEGDESNEPSAVDKQLGITLALKIPEVLPSVFTTLVKKDDKPLTEEEAEELEIEDAINIVTTVVELLDKEAIRRLREQLQRLLSRGNAA